MTEQSEIQRLEEQIHELETEQNGLRTQLTRMQLDQWQARIDDIEVQIHLGALEIGDRVDPLLEVLRNRWLDAVKQVNEGSSTAADTLDALREGFDRALADLRDALVNAKSIVAN